MSTSKSATYDGNCRCGNIKFTVTLDSALAPEGEEKPNRCNCSICVKNGYLLVYPLRNNVIFHNGSWDRMKSYRMGKKVSSHLFCPECSSSVVIDSADSDDEEMREHLAINVSMFKDIDLSKLECTTTDGMNEMDPPYQVPA